MFRKLVILLVAAGLWALPARAEIAIGLAGPLQGQSAALGEQIRKGAQQAIEDINAAGGVRGELLSLKAVDDGCDPRKAVEAANRFVAGGVRFVVGHYCSGSSIPASKIYEAAGVLQISPSSSLPKFTEGGGWNVLRTCPRDDAQGTFAGLFMAAKYKDAKIAIIADQSPANAAVAAKAREALNSMGVTEALFESYTAGAKSYAPLAQKIAGLPVDVIYIAGAYPEAAIILREVKELGRNALMISDDALATDEFWNLTQDLGEGTLMSFLPDPLKIATAQGVIQRFKEKDYVPEGHALNAYAAVEALVRAMDATAGQDPRRMAEWLRSGARVSTVMGNISFDPKGDLKEPRFVWLRWSQGKFSEAPGLNAPP
jgi:branched-chain amino acid transport system substrate-binding protein